MIWFMKIIRRVHWFCKSEPPPSALIPMIALGTSTRLMVAISASMSIGMQRSTKYPFAHHTQPVGSMTHTYSMEMAGTPQHAMEMIGTLILNIKKVKYQI